MGNQTAELHGLEQPSGSGEVSGERGPHRRRVQGRRRTDTPELGGHEWPSAGRQVFGEGGRRRRRVEGHWGTDAAELGGLERPCGGGEVFGEQGQRRRRVEGPRRKDAAELGSLLGPSECGQAFGERGRRQYHGERQQGTHGVTSGEARCATMLGGSRRVQGGGGVAGEERESRQRSRRGLKEGEKSRRLKEDGGITNHGLPIQSKRERWSLVSHHVSYFICSYLVCSCP